MLIRTLSDFVDNTGGTNVQAGRIISVAEGVGQRMLTDGMGRPLNQSERIQVLQVYANETINVFDIRKKSIEPEQCYCCHGTDFLTSKYGARVCRTCHPLATGALKK